jgi:RNA polymerase sigma factor for flagellar operon FliA
MNRETQVKPTEEVSLIGKHLPPLNSALTLHDLVILAKNELDSPAPQKLALEELCFRFEYYLDRTAYRIASSYALATIGLEHSDLKQVGFEALIEGIRGFNPDIGCTFQTYLQRRIPGAMIDQLRRSDHLSRKHRVKVRASLATMEDVSGGGKIRSPSVSVMSTLENLRSPQGIERGDFFETTRDAWVPAEQVTHPFSQSQFWRVALTGLRQRERLAVILFYREGMSIEEMSEELGCSRSTINGILSDVRCRWKERALSGDLFKEILTELCLAVKQAQSRPARIEQRGG